MRKAVFRYLSWGIIASILLISCSVSVRSDRGREKVLIGSRKRVLALNETGTTRSIRALSSFPKSMKNYKRVALHLAPFSSQSEESLYKVEIIPGKIMMVDCNHHTLSGQISVEFVKGAGYPYYIFTTDGSVASTRMACPDRKKSRKMVIGATKFVNYNSGIPIVIYIPKGYDVRFKLWNISDMK